MGGGGGGGADPSTKFDKYIHVVYFRQLVSLEVCDRFAFLPIVKCILYALAFYNHLIWP